MLSTDFVQVVCESPQKIVLVGNGSVTNGWHPIEQVLDAMYAKVLPEWPYMEAETKSAILRYITAMQVFEYRAAMGRITLTLSNHRQEAKVSVFRRIRQIADTFFEFLDELGKAYVVAREAGSISFRGELDRVVREITNETGVITLNWDEVAWYHRPRDAPPTFPNLIQLHGRANCPESLILPTELILTDGPVDLTNLIRNEELRSQAKAAVGSRVRRSFLLPRLVRRNSDIEAQLRQAHSIAMGWLSSASEIILWGMALNEYDSELLTIINLSAEERLHTKKPAYRLKVIDIDPNVKARAAGLFRVPLEEVEWIGASS